MDINSLYDAALNGDKREETRLFEYLRVRFSLFVSHRIKNQEDADDVVQEAMIVISTEYKNIRIQSSFVAWAYKVLDNRILRKLHYYKNTNKLTKLKEQKADNTNPDIKIRLIECLRKLNTKNNRYARILNLHYHGYKSDEICKLIDISKNNMYAILSRARSLLKFCLDTGGI